MRGAVVQHASAESLFPHQTYNTRVMLPPPPPPTSQNPKTSADGAQVVGPSATAGIRKGGALNPAEQQISQNVAITGTAAAASAGEIIQGVGSGAQEQGIPSAQAQSVLDSGRLLPPPQALAQGFKQEGEAETLDPRKVDTGQEAQHGLGSNTSKDLDPDLQQGSVQLKLPHSAAASLPDPKPQPLHTGPIDLRPPAVNPTQTVTDPRLAARLAQSQASRVQQHQPIQPIDPRISASGPYPPTSAPQSTHSANSNPQFRALVGGLLNEISAGVPQHSTFSGASRMPDTTAAGLSGDAPTDPRLRPMPRGKLTPCIMSHLGCKHAVNCKAGFTNR